MNDGKKRRSSAELSAHKRFAKSRSRWKGYPAKPWLCGERTSDEVTEPCCLRRGEGYAIRENESIVSEHNFSVLRGLGQRPNKHETGRFRVNRIRMFSQSGYRFALLAAFLPLIHSIDNIAFSMYNERYALHNAHRTMHFVVKGCRLWLRKISSQRKK